MRSGNCLSSSLPLYLVKQMPHSCQSHHKLLQIHSTLLELLFIVLVVFVFDWQQKLIISNVMEITDIDSEYFLISEIRHKIMNHKSTNHITSGIVEFNNNEKRKTLK